MHLLMRPRKRAAQLPADIEIEIISRLFAALPQILCIAAGLIVVLAAALVLFLFGSPALQRLLRAAGLPGWPLVPVSATQAVVGAIVGISLVRRSGIRLKPLGQIAIGWVAAPAAALVFALVGLFVVQNVFELPVSATPRPAAGARVVAGSAS